MRLDVRDKDYGMKIEDYYWEVWDKDANEKLRHCIMCDEEKGEVFLYVLNLPDFVEKYPKAIIHRPDPGEEVTATIFGNFEFRKGI